jgi:hypothetical protein
MSQSTIQNPLAPPLKPGNATNPAADQITELWGVSVWLGQILREQLGSALLDNVTDADALPFVTDVQAAAIAACTEDGTNGTAQWSWNREISTWRPGYFVGAQHSPGDVRVIVILSSNIEENHPDSGCLSIHDPREGAGNVALPGLPWGRPLKIPGRVGLALAVPGWARWSVSPLREPHQMTVWTAIASRRPSAEGR